MELSSKLKGLESYMKNTIIINNLNISYPVLLIYLGMISACLEIID